MMREIKELDRLLQPSLLKDCTILDHKVTNLTAPGENYGSLMLLVHVEYQENDKQKKTVSIVAKKILENKYFRKMYKVNLTFKKEMELYNTIVPTLIQFQKENNVPATLDIFPRYYGGRINLNDSDEVDEDAVILLENLKASGYITVDRKKGFDLEATELLLKTLATFHAVPLALKFVNPECFKEKILPYTKYIHVYEEAETEDNKKMFYQEKIDIAKENEETAPLAEQVYNGIERCGNYYDGPYAMPREPFATVIHTDFWVNNSMLKYSNSKPIKCKMIDFQNMEMGSPSRDLIFFLFSSVQMSVVKEYYDHLVKLYYDTLMKTLSELNCDTQRFSYEDFENEINIEARNSEFVHILIMLKSVYAEEKDLKDLKDFSEDDIKSHKVSYAHKERAWFVMKQFAKRNWI